MNVSSVETATESIRFIDAAMKQLGDTRSRLGALQNRLEGVTESIGERIEELSASDSRIRDTDFALETTRMIQAQILQEAGIALLVQANLTPRTALSLLQR